MDKIQTAAQMEYKIRMKQRLEGTPLPLEYLIMSGQPVTQADAEKVTNAKGYPNRERIPEPLRMYADLYHELTEQEPTKQDASDWIDTFETWKAKKIDPDSIRMAWAQAQDVNHGFTVGRPGALTITAVGMKSKAKIAQPVRSTAQLEQTQNLIAERDAIKYVPMPENVRRQFEEKRRKR